MKIRCYLSCFVLTIALFGGCAARSAQVENAAINFTFRLLGEPETLDWNKAHTPIETYILMNLMEGLVSFDSKLNVVPAIAVRWTTSPDGRTYTFYLRPDAKWSDGVYLKAKDFVYSWKRLLSPLTAASYAYLLFDIEGAEFYNKGKIQDFDAVGVKALDDYTLQVKLSRPVAHWIYIPTFWVTFPLREDIVATHGNTWDSPGKMVTAGPYKLIGHDHDSKIILKPNPYYFGLRGNVEQITALIITDDSTALSLYESGKLDFLTDLSTLDLKKLAGNHELKKYPYLKTGYLGFAVNKFPLSNPAFRRAIAMAIDKSKLGEIMHGGQQAATSFVPPGMMSYSKSLGLPFNPALARAELRKSGIEGTSSIQLEMILPNWAKPMILAQYIQNELKKNLGLEVSLQPYDHKTFRAQVDMHQYPLFEGSWSADYPDPDNFLSLFLGSSGNNRTTWKNEKYDDLVLNGRSVQNKKIREKIYYDVQKILLEENAVIVPLYYEPNMALVRSKVQGLELNPLNYLLLKKVSIGK